MVIYPGAQCLDITGPLEVFALANRQLRDDGLRIDDVYEIELLAAAAGPVAMSSGIKLIADQSYREAGDMDTLLVCGGTDESAVAQRANGDLTDWLRSRAQRVRRFGSICSGALILAGAGLLDGRRATTHWMDVPELQGFPDIEVDPDAIYVRDGHVYTSAGITSGIDLALAMVEEDCGRRLALKVARRLVLYLKREGGQTQYSEHLSSQVDSDQFGRLIEWIYQNLASPITVTKLAEEAAMSPRNFARCFLQETGVTPAKFVERARVEKSRQLLSEQSLPLEKIAMQCGFQSQEQLRRAFHRQMGVLPSNYRKHFNG
ncbi:transcriptional regulator, AraC family with amidase-like domain [Microbulbifer donghaiensis]|uniref:Transcriptional regulator, AraC family with amidase-like domain n=2 Tax=Microbulbifer donghaiensis TaxID=494016 RepID=A0A1M5AQA1_9GAMM|nr:transcriptional regulator, AraC family with amidase-like domain [Microbulbifer donghaiensis]